MPILPIIDLLILMGWTSLFTAVALKSIYVATTYRPLLFGLGPLDLVIIATVLLIFALALAARTWVKAFEDSLTQTNRRASAALDLLSQGESHAPRPLDESVSESLDEEPVRARPAASG